VSLGPVEELAQAFTWGRDGWYSTYMKNETAMNLYIIKGVLSYVYGGN
jgi:hypothetical protein